MIKKMSRIIQVKVALPLCLCIFFSSGCTHFSPIAVSTSSVNPEREIVLGTARGKATNIYFLGMIDSSRMGMKEAMDDAKRQVGADNLLNVYVDQKTTYYPFILLPLLVKSETFVTGTAIQYKDRSWIKPEPAAGKKE